MPLPRQQNENILLRTSWFQVTKKQLKLHIKEYLFIRESYLMAGSTARPQKHLEYKTIVKSGHSLSLVLASASLRISISFLLSETCFCYSPVLMAEPGGPWFSNPNIGLLILSEVSQTEKDKYHMISLIRRI